MDKEERVGWEEIGRILDGKPKPEPDLFEKEESVPKWAKIDLKRVSVERLRHFGDVYLGLALWKKLTIIPRGPKPIRVLNELGVPFAFTVPEPNTWQDIVKALDEHQSTVPLAGRRVAIQEYGIPNEELASALTARGATVLRVPVYRWALPDDTGPLKEAVKRILNAQAQVAVFTTSVQMDHLLQVADQTGGRDALKKALNRMVIASVGPDCSQTIRSHGLPVDLEPESPKMGPLVLETADKARDLWNKKSQAAA